MAIDDTVDECSKAYPVILEVFRETDIEIVKESMNQLGYIFDDRYLGVPLDRAGERPTTIYRVFIPDDLKDDARDRLSELDFTYQVWGDSKIEPMDTQP